MTWGEFKKQIETAGVKDDENIWYIDVHGEIESIAVDEHLGLEVWG